MSLRDGDQETFTEDNIQKAIQNFLDFSDQMFEAGHQGGYFNGGGWAARVLRYHLRQLKEAKSD